MKVAQSCLALCDPIDYTAHGIFQVRILELVPFPSPGDLPNPGIESRSPTLQADFFPAELLGSPSFNYCQTLFNACVSFKHTQEKIRSYLSSSLTTQQSVLDPYY